MRQAVHAGPQRADHAGLAGILQPIAAAAEDRGRAPAGTPGPVAAAVPMATWMRLWRSRPLAWVGIAASVIACGLVGEDHHASRRDQPCHALPSACQRPACRSDAATGCDSRRFDRRRLQHLPPPALRVGHRAARKPDALAAGDAVHRGSESATGSAIDGMARSAVRSCASAIGIGWKRPHQVMHAAEPVGEPPAGEQRRDQQPRAAVLARRQGGMLGKQRDVRHRAADPVAALDHRDAPAAARQRIGHRATGKAGADDDGVGVAGSRGVRRSGCDGCACRCRSASRRRRARA